MRALIYLLFLSTPLFAQQAQTEKPVSNKNSSAKLFNYGPEDQFNNDLKSEKLTLYLLGGIVSVIREADSEFEKKFQIRYHDFGCMPPSDFEFYEKYNQSVFNHLTAQYGKDWIASANANAFGFEKWKEEQL